jgi:hypothetical protein
VVSRGAGMMDQDSHDQSTFGRNVKCLDHHYGRHHYNYSRPLPGVAGARSMAVTEHFLDWQIVALVADRARRHTLYENPA